MMQPTESPFASYTITLIDIVADAQRLYGNWAELIFVQPLPAHDWRFHIVTPTGAQITMHRGATNNDVAAYLLHNQVETTKATG